MNAIRSLFAVGHHKLKQRCQGEGLSMHKTAMVFGGLLLVADAAQAAEPKLDTTADLVSYCDSVGPSGEVRDGQAFCDGFIAGAGLFYMELIRAKQIKQLACADEIPTLTEARQSFVDWAAANPSHMQDKPIDGFWRAMAETYPCTK